MQNVFQSWSDIRVFLAVVRKGSTLAASRELGLAQPTVARRIEALEHEIGLDLFLRDTRGFRPTEAAQALLQHAEQIEQSASAFEVRAQEIRHARPIRITAFPANLNDQVMRIFSEFSERHPEYPLEFLPGIKPLDLAGGEADIAMRISWSPLNPDLICRHISTARFTLFGSSKYAERHGLPGGPEEMKHHALFTFQRDDIPPVFHNWLLSHAPPSAIKRSFSEASLMDAAVRAGQGLGILNIRMTESEEKAGTLIRCFEPPDALCAPHVLLVSPQANRRPEVKTFTRFFGPRYAALFK